MDLDRGRSRDGESGLYSGDGRASDQASSLGDGGPSAGASVSRLEQLLRLEEECLLASETIGQVIQTELAKGRRLLDTPEEGGQHEVRGTQEAPLEGSSKSVHFQMRSRPRHAGMVGTSSPLLSDDADPDEPIDVLALSGFGNDMDLTETVGGIRDSLIPEKKGLVIAGRRSNVPAGGPGLGEDPTDWAQVDLGLPATSGGGLTGNVW